MLGDRLRKLRKSCGLSQYEVSQKIGVREATVSQWERLDSIVPTPHRVRQLCEIYKAEEQVLELLALTHTQRGQIQLPVSQLTVDELKALTKLELDCSDRRNRY